MRGVRVARTPRTKVALAGWQLPTQSASRWVTQAACEAPGGAKALATWLGLGLGLGLGFRLGLRLG